MPNLESSFKPPFFFRNYHISTIYASLFRKVDFPKQLRERIELKDGDFIDLDWSFSYKQKADKLLIILHGLEGNAQRPYVLGMARHFNQSGWDTAAVNFRGCSGEINRLYPSYNAGASGDLEQIISYIISKNKYPKLAVTGFSLGGNLLLKYLGEGNELPKELKAAAAISVPCDLYGSVQKLAENSNYIYERKFILQLKKQLHIRKSHFPNLIKKEEIKSCRSILDIDDLYTSRAHGYKNALDYYKKSSSLQFLENINIPTLLLNARNDNFLSKACFPVEIATRNTRLFLETPEYGGHVGFIQKGPNTYSEVRVLEFLSEKLKN